ncbi:zinc finger domain-containing protein [Glutamicibacter arilaitensis]|uniref:zinc finger domain-containing protein n=1 Tax=Glutamicibacter arilaitensis TaxID=256701 RepID=UPI003FD6382D
MNTSKNRDNGRSTPRTPEQIVRGLNGTAYERMQKQLAESPAFERMQKEFTKSPAYERMQKQLAESPAFERMQKEFTKSPAYERMQKQLAESPAFERMQKEFTKSPAYERVMASSAVSNFIGVFVDQFDYSSVDEMVDAIARNSTELDLEEFGDEKSEDVPPNGLSHGDAEWVDPLQKAIFKHSAERFTRLQKRYPEYSERAIEGLNKFTKIITYNLIIQVVVALFTGGAGPILTPLITALTEGSGEYISGNRKEKRSYQSQYGLSIECSFCHAAPGEWCIIVRGSAPGGQASNLHKPRIRPDQSSS